MNAEGQAMTAIMTVRHLKHELRTPINQIVGFSELILEEIQDNPDIGDMDRLTAVCALGKSLASAIEGVLSGPAAATPEHVSPEIIRELRDAVQRTVQRVRHDLCDSGFSVRCNQKDDLKRILSATARLAEFARTGDLA